MSKIRISPRTRTIRKARIAGERGNVQASLLTLAVVLAAIVAVWFLVSRYLAGPTRNGLGPLSTSAYFKGDPAEATDKLLKALNQKLQDMDLLKLLNKEVETHSVTVQGRVFPSYIEWFREPPQYKFPQINEQFKAVAQSLGAKVEQDKETYSFEFTFEWRPVYISFEPEPKSRICLIIDDGGYQKGEALEALYGFKVPVTVAIIPDAEFSTGLAEEFPSHGVEVMCHMPMEGHEKGMVGGNYKEILKKGMGDPQVKAEVERALSGLPHCRGLNNHMGSVATTDPELIWEVCQVLKGRDMFIIDSRTTAQSVVEPVAKKAGLPVAHRDVFLDNVENPEAILKQLSQLVSRAKRKGLAVGIGHFKALTLKTLEGAIPALKEQGIQFVYASEIVK